MQPHSYHQHRFCGILPPHILHEIANRGTHAQRAKVLDTLRPTIPCGLHAPPA